MQGPEAAQAGFLDPADSALPRTPSLDYMNSLQAPLIQIQGGGLL